MTPYFKNSFLPVVTSSILAHRKAISRKLVESASSGLDSTTAAFIAAR